LIDQLNRDIEVLLSRILFINNIIDGLIVINKQTKKQIENQLDKFDKILRIEGSYEYLLNMKIYNLTKESILKYENNLKIKKQELIGIKKTSPAQMWVNDLIILEKNI
jgi:hypothetical protein